MNSIPKNIHNMAWPVGQRSHQIVFFLESTYPPHLSGHLCYRDNVEDEWLVVYLLLEISKRVPNLVIRWVLKGLFLNQWPEYLHAQRMMRRTMCRADVLL